MRPPSSRRRRGELLLEPGVTFFFELEGEILVARAHDATVEDLEAARGIAGEGRLVAAFQPHLVSRTRIFGSAMGEALGAADEVIVVDVYLAREEPDPAVTGALVADAVPRGRTQVSYVPRLEEAPARLAEIVRRGDLVLTLGAGTLTTVGPDLLARLQEADDD